MFKVIEIKMLIALQILTMLFSQNEACISLIVFSKSKIFTLTCLSNTRLSLLKLDALLLYVLKIMHVKAT